MSPRARFLLGVITGIILTVVVGAAVALSGVIPMTVRDHPGPLDELGDRMFDASVTLRAPRITSPHSADASSLRGGFEGYRDMCVQCHGAPGVSRSEWAAAMMPQPPDLVTPDIQSRTDGQLFYIINGGVRMTGMPGFGRVHDDDDIWDLVAFIRELHGISPDQRAALTAAVRGDDHPRHDETIHASPK